MASTSSEAALLGFVGQIYEAAEDPRRWEGALTGIAASVHADLAALVSEDLRSGRANVASSVRFEGSIAGEYERYFAARNPWMASGTAPPPDGVVTGEMLLSDAELIRTEYYNDFLRRLGLRHVSGAIFLRPGRRIFHVSLLRGRRRGPFDDEEVNFLRRLAPHLERAIQLHTRLTDLRADYGSVQEALDQAAIGIVLVANSGRALFLNRSAREIIAQRDGLELKRNELLASNPEEATSLRAQIRGAARTGAGELGGTGGALLVSRPSLRRPYSVFVVPLARREASEFGDERSAAVIFVSDPERLPEVPRFLLQRLYGLTAAESRVAQLLLEGRSVDECAAILEVTSNTARTHVRRLLEKAGVHRYGELVRVLLLSCARLRPEVLA